MLSYNKHQLFLSSIGKNLCQMFIVAKCHVGNMDLNYISKRT